MSGPRLLSWIAVAIAVMCTALAMSASASSEGAHLIVRWTARTSLALFLLAYVARPLVVHWPSPATKAVLARRKWIGLGFALSHLAHLGGIVAIAAPDFAGFVRSQKPTIIVALLAYVVLFAMAITSIDAVRARISAPAWKRLHRFGIHLLWVPFASTYAGAMFVEPVFAIPTALLVAAAVLRFTARSSRSRPRPA